MMRVILDCRTLTGDFHTYEANRFLVDCLLRLEGGEAGLDCLFLKSGPDDPATTPIIPVSNLIFDRSFRGPWGFNFGLGGGLPDLLKRFHADFLIGDPGIRTTGLPVPYGLWIPGHQIPRGRAKPKRKWGRALAGAALVLTDSDYHRRWILQRFSLSENKVVALQGAADENFLPLSGAEREKVKEQYTGSKEYFIVTQTCRDQDGLLYLLKSFSIFKKKQKSNMQLVVTGAEQGTLRLFSGKKETFRYRNDLHFLGPLPVPELARLLAASYGVLQPFSGSSPLSLLDAFQTRVPVIASQQGPLPEIAGDSALYISGKDPEELAAQMISLYKDENLRDGLIEKGRIRLGRFGWEKNIIPLRQAIQRAVQQEDPKHYS
jgi:glycosyltransferase involved in cell wall biosynthesis